MHVTVNRSRGNDRAFSRNDAGSAADHQVDIIGDLRISSPANTGYPAILDSDVALEDAHHRVDHQRIGNHQIKLAWTMLATEQHTVTHRPAKSGDWLEPMQRVVTLDPGKKVGIAQPYPVPGGWPKHPVVVTSVDSLWHQTAS